MAKPEDKDDILAGWEVVGEEAEPATATTKEEDELLAGWEVDEEEAVAKPTTQASSLDPSKPMATTLDSIYYGGPEGEALRQKEERLDSIVADEFASVEYTPAELAAMRKEIDDEKQARYDQIQGENIVEIPGFGGKLLKNPDGSTNFIPPPYFRGGMETAAKTSSDTLRGILGLPELVGMEGYQDIIPKVASEDEAVIIASELIQLTTGGLGALTIGNKLKMAEKLGKAMPAFDKIFNSVMVKGTLSTSVGAAATADEDIGTLFGDEEMTMAEAKTRALAEGLALGAIMKLPLTAGKKLSGYEAIQKLGTNLKQTIALLTRDADETVIEALAKQLNEGKSALARAKTPEEIRKAQEDLLLLAETQSKQITGMSLDELAEKAAKDELADDQYVPTVGELLDDNALIRLYTGMRLTTSSDEALSLVSKLLTNKEQGRLEAIMKQGEKIIAEYAPKGKEAAVEARDLAEKTVQGQRATVEKATEGEMADIQATDLTERQRILQEEETALQATDTRRAQEVATAEEETAQLLRQQEQQIAEAEAQKEGALNVTTRAMEESPVSTSNINTLMNQTDESGIVKPISDTLRRDIQVKDNLADTMKREYEAVPLDTDDVVTLLDTMITTAQNANIAGSASGLNSVTSLSTLISALTKRLPAEDAVEAVGKASMSAGSDVAAEIKRLEGLMNSATNIQDHLKYAKEISNLLRSSGTKAPAPSAPVGTGGAPAPVEMPELPSLTANDLLEVKRAVSAQAKAFNAKAATEPALAVESKKVADLLSTTDSILSSKIDDLTVDNPTAQAAREEFDNFFKGTFSERWRTEMGRDWQDQIFGTMNQADIARAEERIVKIVSNPNASKESLAQIRGIVDSMDDATRAQFGADLAPRIATDFAMSNKDMLLVSTNPADNLKKAQQAVRAIERFRAGTQGYFEMLPGASRILDDVYDNLKRVVDINSGVIQEADVAIKEGTAGIKETTKAGTAAVREAERGAQTEAKAISSKAKMDMATVNAQTNEAMAAVRRSLSAAQDEINKSAFARLTGVADDPSVFFARSLTNPERGASDIRTLWDNAAKYGEVGDNGLTPAQEAIKEGVVEALMTKSVSAVAGKADEPSRIALAPLLDATAKKGSTANQIVNNVFVGDESGLELIETFGEAVASSRRAGLGRAAPESMTGPLQALTGNVKELNTVIFGPLSKEARIANFLTKVSGGLLSNAGALAKSYADIMTNPAYTKRIIEEAARLKREAMMPPEEATGKAFLKVFMLSLGFKQYEKASDPWFVLEEHYKSFSQGTETEEAFSL